MFDIVLICRRPTQLPPMSVQIFIPCSTNPGNLQSAMLLLSRVERRSIITIQCRSVKTTRMVRHPAALLLLILLLLLLLLSLLLLLLLSLRLLSLKPSQRPGRSGVGLICVLCTAIKTLQRKSCPKASAKYSNTDSDPRARSKNNVNIVCDVAYDLMDQTYDIAYDEYPTTL
jgi:hypothetical protein